jgi:isoleucyl-tRNA synthetase
MKIEDIKDKMLKDNNNIPWVPETANNSFKSWVSNLRDNSISRQRFWGTPLPIWECSKCKEHDVFGSAAELKKKSGKESQDLHIPWIDRIDYSCKCGGTKKRVPDVIDVWIDSGTASWNCLDNKKELIKEWFPADFILEAKEQTRLWFSMLSICSQIAFNKNCYKNVYVHGMLTDIEGKKMSKSLGNIISPYELIDKYGVDVLRYYMCQKNAGQEINFNWDECAVKGRYLRVLWNVHKFLIDLAKENETNPFKLNEELMEKLFNLEERFIISKLHKTIKEVSSLFDDYKLDETINLIEKLFLELSRTYIQIVREKSSVGSKAEKDVCLYVISNVLLEVVKLFAPNAPFITEAIYLNFKEEFGLTEESIHHCSWPSFDKKKIDSELEEEMEIAQNVIAVALNLREQIGFGVRWPLKELVVASEDKKAVAAVEKLRDIIKRQTNIKDISIMEELPGVETSVKSDYKKIAPLYKELSPKIIARLSIDSPETVLNHIKKEGAYRFKVEGKNVEIKEEHLLVERKIPLPYKEGEFKGGLIYVSEERTPELEGEGFSREIMRSVQQLRKESGLEKKDKIKLFVKVDEDLLEKIDRFKNDIKEKVGAVEIELGSVKLKKKYEFSDKKKIKKEDIEFWFDKV